MLRPQWISTLFFFNDTATTEIYTLSLHDALPIFLGIYKSVAIEGGVQFPAYRDTGARLARERLRYAVNVSHRSEEHTSELQSRLHLVCRLLLEKKKNSHTPLRICQRSVRVACTLH